MSKTERSEVKDSDRGTAHGFALGTVLGMCVYHFSPERKPFEAYVFLKLPLSSFLNKFFYFYVELASI